MASSPIKLKLQHRQSILMENVFSLQQVEQVGIYQHDVVDEIFEEVKNEADEEKQYLQSKINFDNKSSLKVDIEKMLKNRNKKLKKLHKVTLDLIKFQLISFINLDNSIWFK